jgi:LacI family transcriptional regulator
MGTDQTSAFVSPEGAMGDAEEDSNGRRRPSTIIDVANEAGVAIGTVSRYLNGLPVRAGNRDLIEDAIRRLGYRRNALAAAMKSDLTNMAGFMVPGLSEFHIAILEQLSERLRRAGRGLLTYCHNDDRGSIVEALDFFAAHRVDCLVMDGHEEASEGVRELIAGGTPVIVYDNDVPGLPVDRVLVENRAASARAVGHLLDIGHTRIAVLAGNLRDYTGGQRLEGYLQAMRERGIEIVPDYIVEAGWVESRGYAGMLRLLTLEHPPTAIFSSNYNMAVGAIALLKEHGYRIPVDMSVVSFDDVPLFRLHEAGITAVAQPVEMIAETIAGLMTARLSEEGQYHAPHTITLGCDIILRGSTRRPADGRS